MRNGFTTWLTAAIVGMIAIACADPSAPTHDCPVTTGADTCTGH